MIEDVFSWNSNIAGVGLTQQLTSLITASWFIIYQSVFVAFSLYCYPFCDVPTSTLTHSLIHPLTDSESIMEIHMCVIVYKYLHTSPTHTHTHTGGRCCMPSDGRRTKDYSVS